MGGSSIQKPAPNPRLARSNNGKPKSHDQYVMRCALRGNDLESGTILPGPFLMGICGSVRMDNGRNS
jgi:hypothetical protein